MLKTHISRITLIAFIITTIMTGCNNAPISMTGIVEKVKANSTQAGHVAPGDSSATINEYLDYKGAVLQKVRQNDQRIASLKEKINEGETGIAAEYQKRLDELEQRNINLSSRILHYKEGAPENWKAFKHHFNKDINEIDKTISLMAENNYSQDQ
jgi:hypothetical protein